MNIEVLSFLQLPIENERRDFYVIIVGGQPRDTS